MKFDRYIFEPFFEIQGFPFPIFALERQLVAGDHFRALLEANWGSGVRWMWIFFMTFGDGFLLSFAF